MSSAKLGKWGGAYGDPKDVPTGRCPSQLVRVVVYSDGNVINALEFTYKDNCGVQHDMGPWGNPGDCDAAVVKVGEAGTHLKEISGTYGEHKNVDTCIRSLNFVTAAHSKQHRYGKHCGDAFKITVEEGQIVGFHGSAGNLLDAIGVYIRPPC